jgi:phosphoribosylformylglycinamidine synthase
VTAPLSLIVSGFSPVLDVRKTVTPQLRSDFGDSQLLLIDLGAGANRMGGSILAQVYGQLGDTAPDVDSPESLKNFFEITQELIQQQQIIAYHDRSDGGLFTTLAEMAFAGRTGLSINLDSLGSVDGLDEDGMAVLFNEELGAVIQVAAEHADSILAQFRALGVKCSRHRYA